MAGMAGTEQDNRTAKTGTGTHYLALYRKYRPQTFEDVVGRDAIVQTLKNQIISGRIGHSYLFCGTRGTGKTTIAKIFARAVNCEHPVNGSPCGTCATCRAIEQNADLNVVEMDAASNNGVDDIRNIIEQVSYSPTQGRYRVFIIDEVHMLSVPAFNALLKTLEEPPSYAIFILATTEPNRLPLTILSRCQRYNFGRLSVPVIEDRLRVVCEREGLHCEARALQYIASAADGSMRDGLSILDQCNAFNYGNEVLTYEKTLEILGAVDSRVFSELFRDIHTEEVRKALEVLDRILQQGRELVQFITDFIGYLRDIMLLKASEDIAPSLDVTEENLTRMIEDARSSELEEDMRYIDVFSSLTEQIRYSPNRRILTEAALIRLCNPAMDLPANAADAVRSMQERIRVLEDKIAEDEQRLAAGGAGTGAAGATPVTARNLQTDPLAQEAGAPAGGETEKKKAVPVLPAAVPEDLQKIAADWDRLIAAIPKEQHLMKIYLRHAKPTITKEGGLLLVFDNYVYCDFFTGKGKENNREYFAAYLSRSAGSQIEPAYKALDKGDEFSDNYVDIRKIAKAVNMDIVEDDSN